MKLCMIGTGYVGLVSGVCFSDLGNDVICVDKDEKKISNLKNSIIPIYEPGLDELVKKNYKAGRLNFTSDLSKAVKNSNIIFICVGTPTKKNGIGADLSQIFSAANEISKNINSYKIIINKSTVPVTTHVVPSVVLTSLMLTRLMLTSDVSNSSRGSFVTMVSVIVSSGSARYRSKSRLVESSFERFAVTLVIVGAFVSMMIFSDSETGRVAVLYEVISPSFPASSSKELML